MASPKSRQQVASRLQWIGIILLTTLLIVSILFTSSLSIVDCITDQKKNEETSTTAKVLSVLLGDASTVVNTAKFSAKAVPCQCTMPDKWYAQSGQDKFLFERLFFQQGLCCKGVFVEFGALNGIDHSNTYAFEHYMGWKGLMFEIDPNVYVDLERNRPSADIIIGAVCPSGESNITVLLSVYGGFSGSIKQYEETRRNTKRNETVVKCYNLADELRKRGMMRVDYLTMDTEGSEVDLVLDFPWDDFDVRMVQIEQLNEGKYTGQVGKKDKIIQHMLSHGYELYNVFVVASDDTDDLMFVRNLPRFDLKMTNTT